MWGSKSDTAGAIFNGTIGTARFGANKTDNTPHEAKIAGKRVEIYFSPSDQVNRNIIRTINSAQTSFQFSQLLITRTDLGLTIRARYDSVTNRACTGGMVEDTSSSGGVPFIIMNNGTNNAFKIYRSSLIFHHKYLIVDQDAPNSDPLVWTGSHNWSNAGDQRNDENSIVIHDQAIANQYYQEFAARYAELNGTICPLTAIKHEARGKISLYPNPATSTLSVNGLKEGLANYTITDAAGRVAQKGKLSGSSFSVGNLKSGVYHLTLSQKTGNTHHIFVKQ